MFNIFKKAWKQAEEDINLKKLDDALDINEITHKQYVLEKYRPTILEQPFKDMWYINKSKGEFYIIREGIDFSKSSNCFRVVCYNESGLGPFMRYEDIALLDEAIIIAKSLGGTYKEMED